MIRTLEQLGVIDGRQVQQATLRSGEVEVSLLSLGCITRDWRISGQSVVLGYADPREYLDNPFSFGIIAGRVANRIAHGRFLINGHETKLDCNSDGHHLHGGFRGLGRRNWQMESCGPQAICLSYLSEDGEEGYPGNVEFTVEISLHGYRLTYDMRATTDRLTPINLAQHSYYNLAGSGSAREHELCIRASRYTPTDDALIPTGEIASVTGTRYDFLSPRSLQAADPAQEGYDINLVLDDDTDGSTPAATIKAEGMALRLWTDQPGLQLYDAMHMGRVTGGHDGRVYQRFGGVCLEAQKFPDAPNHPEFPSILHSPDQPYHQCLEVEIAPETG